MKIAVFVVLTLLFCLPQCALAGPDPESPASDMPAFSATVDGISLPYIAAPISWNGAQFNRPDALVSLME